VRILWAPHQGHFISNPKTVKPDNFCNRLQAVATTAQTTRFRLDTRFCSRSLQEIGAKYLVNVARSGHFA
jgi:hypothetical protein